jgi:nucleoside phosphorylase
VWTYQLCVCRRQTSEAILTEWFNSDRSDVARQRRRRKLARNRGRRSSADKPVGNVQASKTVDFQRQLGSAAALLGETLRCRTPPPLSPETAGEALKRRLRTGTVVTYDDRNWELRWRQERRRIDLSRAIAVDMESGTVATQGFRLRVPYGALLCVSD